MDVDVVPSNLEFTLIPAILVLGAVVLGIVFLIMIVILIGRRVSINLKTGGAVTLTLASILFLSGVWCMVLSPIVTYPETEDHHSLITIDDFSSWSYPINVREGDILIVDFSLCQPFLNGTMFPESQLCVNVWIFNPETNIVWSEMNTTHTFFRMKALGSGTYRVEVQNANPVPLQASLHVTVDTYVTIRPLESFGSWLALISLPTFGLGIWASGLLQELKEYMVLPRPSRSVYRFLTSGI